LSFNFLFMYAIPHSLLGIAIASKTNNPALISALAVLSHYVLDMIPHWNLLPKKRPVSTLINRFLLRPIFKKNIINEKRGLKDIHDLIFLLDPVLALIIIYLFIYYQSSIAPAKIVIAAFFALLPDILVYIDYRYPGKFKIFKILHQFHINIQNHTKSVFWGVLTQVIVICLALAFIYYL